MTPELSVIIPYFNRPKTIQLVLESVARARGSVRVETILVDDGSTPPAAEQLAGGKFQPDRIVRQENQGLLFARLAGLKAAEGEYVLFLDSDDLVGPEKFDAQLSAMRERHADVSYTDYTEAELREPYDAIAPAQNFTVAEDTRNGAEFFIRVQPPPHSPIFLTSWLRPLVDRPLFPPSSLYNPVAEIWFYHIAAPFPAKVVKVAGPHTIVGRHGGERITNTWEKMAVASLAVMEAFVRHCPRTPETRAARQLVGEKAFGAWRALPRDFFPEFDRRMLQVWRSCPAGPRRQLGGSKFQWLSRLVGAVAAARLFRRFSGATYASCRTLSAPADFDRWMAQLPPPAALTSP